ncbi:MAG: DUF4835 family protein [Fimbriimonadaceae bacterium]|nr:DUF4835 family protein [Chitinophagales bacterium]
MRNLIILLTFLFSVQLYAQELNCGVTINTQQVKITDPKVFKTLETSIREFMNTRKWSDDNFKPEEKIDCQIVITIREENGSDKFKAQATIISTRPVYGSDYKTTVLNTVDNDFEFIYAEYQPLEFNENNFISNLTSVLAYYAYVIIGLDYDSFSKNGGDKYYQRALNIITQASNREEKGWKAYDGTRNRYWLIDNILDPKLGGFRDAFYSYHRQGLDLMYNDQVTPIATISKSLQTFDNINRTQPNSMILQLFFTAKSDELIGIYQNAAPTEKAKAVNYLMRLDPSNGDDYQQIMGTR